MAIATLYTTQYGAGLLAKKGWVDTVKFWSASDADRNYAVGAEQILIPYLGGGDQLTPKTAAYCGVSNYEGMLTNPTSTEIKELTQNGVLYFNRVNCDNEFSTPQLTVNIHIQRWINELRQAIVDGYDFNMAETVQKVIYDYMNVSIREMDIVSSDYVNIGETTDFNVSYVPTSTVDIINYKSLSPLFVEYNGQNRTVYQGSSRFNSPLRLSFSTATINGKVTNGMSSILTLSPDYWGYYTDLGFVPNFREVEIKVDAYEYIYPAVSIGGNIFWLNSNTTYNVKSGDQIGWYMNFVNDEGKTALEELIDRLILYFKTSGNLVDGIYNIPLNFNVTLTGNKVNNLDIFGNNIVMNFIFDSSDTTLPITDAEIVEIVN